MGLIVASLVNWLAIFLVLPGFVLPMRPEFAPRMPMGIFLSVVAILALSSALILIGALRMQRLESLAWARTAGVLAMLIGPGYIVGWPVGIWARSCSVDGKSARRLGGRVEPRPCTPRVRRRTLD